MKKLFIALICISTSIAYAKKTNGETPFTPSTNIAGASQPSQQEIKVGVKGMVCAFCAQGIEKKFKEQSEIASVEVSLENKYVKLKFKEGQNLKKEQITEILKDAGYEAVYGE